MFSLSSLPFPFYPFPLDLILGRLSQACKITRYPGYFSGPAYQQTFTFISSSLSSLSVVNTERGADSVDV